MIDDVTFSAHMTVLEDRFSRKPLMVETKAQYLDYLSQRMTTEQFEAAAREIFNKDTFWPSPQRFLDIAAGGSVAELAKAAWGELLELAKRGQWPELAELPAATRAGLKAAPFREIAYSEGEYNLTQLKRAFVEAYTRAATNAAPAENNHHLSLEHGDYQALGGQIGGSSGG